MLYQVTENFVTKLTREYAMLDKKSKKKSSNLSCGEQRTGRISKTSSGSNACITLLDRSANDTTPGNSDSDNENDELKVSMQNHV